MNYLQTQFFSTTMSLLEPTKKVLLLGSGMVVPPIVEYLMDQHDVVETLTIGGIDMEQTEELCTKYSKGLPRNQKIDAVKIDATNPEDQKKMNELIKTHDAVLSLLPATMHTIVARQCLDNNVNMFTASYISPDMKKMHKEATDKGLFILNEIGLDPGIDHMCVMKTLAEIKKKKGILTGFESHCGALPSAEASNNPIGYKFSWSPIGVLSASKNPAYYMMDGEEKRIAGENLVFSGVKRKFVCRGFDFEMYPNRDSMGYIDYYGMDKKHLKKMIRGTLRFPGYLPTFRLFNRLGLLKTDNNIEITSKLTWFDVMKQIVGSDCYSIEDLKNEISNKLSKIYDGVKYELDLFKNCDIKEDIKYAISSIKDIGLFGIEPIVESIPKLKKEIGNKVSPIWLLTQHLVKVASLEGNEKDLVYMSHHFDVEYPETGKKEEIVSTLCCVGEQDQGKNGATAKTVGLPIAIATNLYLRGELDELKGKGVIGPTLPVVYEKCLDALAKENIIVKDVVIEKE